MTQGKIERWHLTLKNRILLENYYLPGELSTQSCLSKASASAVQRLPTESATPASYVLASMRSGIPNEGRKYLWILVGATGIEPVTLTMSR
jgi:hypothetical protein